MNNKYLNVLFCIHSLSNGGAERVLINTINALKKNTNWNIDLLLVVNDKTIENKLLQKINIYHIFSKETKLSRQIVKRFPAEILHKILIKKTYDIEIAFLEGDATKIISGAKTKKICWIHTDMNHYQWSNKYYRNLLEEKKAYAKFDRRICVSAAVGNEFNKKFGLETTFIMNLLNPDNVKQLSQQQKDPFNHSYINTLSIGSLKPVKGYERLINAYAKAKIQNVKWKHYFIGNGSEANMLVELAHNHFPDHFVFEGYKENPYPWLKNADLLICSSYAEGFSSVVYEALILGIPVLTTDVSGMKEMLGDSIWGLIVDNNEKGLAEGLERMLGNRYNLIKYKNKAIERGNEFCQEKQINEIISMIEQIFVSDGNIYE